MGRSHLGEKMPGPAIYEREQLIFPSGEMFPRCWKDPDYGIVKPPTPTQAILVR